AAIISARRGESSGARARATLTWATCIRAGMHRAYRPHCGRSAILPLVAERFEATLEEPHRVEVPFDVRAVFGRARAPVRGTINGHPFRTTVAVYGGRHYLGFRREIREAAGIVAGQAVTIELELDDEPRVV